MEPATHTPATFADLEALPDDVIGELIDGVLYTSPRPRLQHGGVASQLLGELFGPYQRARGGPGGWFFVFEPGITLPGAPEVVPDIAGWRRERLDGVDQTERLRVVPDWVCEVLSPSTRRHDKVVKKPLYARSGVEWLWLADPAVRELTVYRRTDDGEWREVGFFTEAPGSRVAPFEEAEIDLSTLWGPGPSPFIEPD